MIVLFDKCCDVGINVLRDGGASVHTLHFFVASIFFFLKMDAYCYNPFSFVFFSRVEQHLLHARLSHPTPERHKRVPRL